MAFAETALKSSLEPEAFHAESSKTIFEKLISKI